MYMFYITTIWFSPDSMLFEENKSGISEEYFSCSTGVEMILKNDISSLVCKFISIYSNSNPHYHVMPLAWISLTLSRHFSLSLIASGWSSGLHPVSSHSCCMYVRAGRPAFSRQFVEVHRSTSLMSSSLLLQQCPACLVCLTWIVFCDGRQVAV